MVKENPKGMRDLLPKEKLLKNRVVRILKKYFERCGFEPLETPCIQKYETLASKYAGGAEILKETYSFEDRGERKLGLRYDLTVPLCRVIAMNKQIPKPFKRYEIGRAWRDGPVKKGRLREFWQCDVDTVGSESMMADAEFLKIIQDVLEDLNFEFIIKFNNRKLLNGILKSTGIPEKDWNPILQSIDKLVKIGETGVKKELKEKGFKTERIEQIFELILTQKKDDELLNELKEKLNNKLAKQGINEIKKLINYAKLLGIKDENLKWEISLSRGLDYYTSTVYEAYLKNSRIKSAIAAGGRYDNIIGNFIDGEERIPAVGLSFGIDTIIEAFKEEKNKSITQVLVIPVGKRKEALKITKKLRELEINTDVDLMERGISKNLDYANTKGIPWVVIVGEQEVEASKITLKNMETGDQEMVNIEEVKEMIK